uniref:Uncharacterized protein n=1 Tax=Tanacetum cinerariifolium TaxID=118510 RepID=A0A6L2NL64_TANCI|nr:hypothetical protein [Tanacetum cinerariifolium]
MQWKKNDVKARTTLLLSFLDEHQLRFKEKISHCQEDRTAINVKKKLPVKGGSYANAIFLAMAYLFFWQWQLSSLAVGSSSGSGNSITCSGNALCILFPTKESLNVRLDESLLPKSSSLVDDDIIESQIIEN